MDTAPAVDTHDMVLVHRVFRRELLLLPELVRAAAGDPARAERVRAHAAELVGFLHHHHEGEDALIWPRLRERVAVEQDLVDRMERQHEAVAVLLTALEAALPAWQGDAARGEELATLVERLRGELLEHLDEEERSILPLVGRTFSPAEWAELGQRGFAAVAPARRMVTLGQILEDADDAERRAFLAHLPLPVRVLYGLLGRRQHARETAALRLPLQRRG